MEIFFLGIIIGWVLGVITIILFIWGIRKFFNVILISFNEFEYSLKKYNYDGDNTYEQLWESIKET